MTFFYDLNKKLDSIREKPETTHKQLNERDEGKPGKNFAKIANDAGERYGSKAAGERVAGAVRNKLKAQGKLEEGDMDESAFQAAIGKKKYGADGMKALQKAGREGASKATMARIRDKHDQYDEGIEDRIGDLDMTNPVNQPAYQRKAAAQGGNKVSKPPIIGNRREGYPRMSGGGEVAPMPKSREGYPRFSGGGGYTGKGVKEEDSAVMTPKQKSFAKLAPPVDKITFADKIAGAKKEVDEMLGDVAAEAMKSALKGGQKKLDKNDNGRLDANDFAMLRAGKKHSVKEDDSSIRDDLAHEIQMILDSALGGLDQTDHIIDELGDMQQAVEQSGDSVAMQALQIMSSGIDEGAKKQIRLARKALSLLKGKQETDEGWDDMLKAGEERRHSGMKTGEKTQGHKGEIERTATGIRHTRRYDPKTGETDAGDDASTSGEKRGRGRPKGSKASIGAKGPSGKSKLMTREADHDSEEIKQAVALLKKAGYTVEKTQEELDEKAVSGNQAVAARIARGIQKGEVKAEKGTASAEMAKMEPSELKKFAKTDTNSLPKKVKKEKTEEAGGSGTPTASSGFSFGKGIYDSMNRDLESMIAESMNVSMNMNTDANGGPSRSLTVTATDDDAMKLGQLLKNAGLGGDHDMGNNGAAEVEVHGAEDIADRIRQALGGDHGPEEVCGDCGHADCECDHEQMDEAYGDTAVDENNPDFPSNTEYNSDALQYAGGLNKPKTDVAGDGQTTIPNTAVHTQDQDELRRLREMAGIKEAAKPDFLDVDNDKNKKESFKQAIDDKEEKKVDEGILAATANLWKEYKGQYGV